MTTQETISRAAEGGHWGKDIRSDVHIAFEVRNGGGVEILLESRVAPYYGNAIMEQARAVLDELGVKHARVSIHDEGALPFVIAARIETAVRRAGLALGKRSLPVQHSLLIPSSKDRLRRSRLYLPGSEPKYYINAELHAPDAVILDLEDSVHRDEKDAARILVRNTLRAVDFGGCERMVRINQLPLGLEDLAEVVGEVVTQPRDGVGGGRRRGSCGRPSPCRYRSGRHDRRPEDRLSMPVPRIAWEHLPASVRHAVEALIGPVVSATTVGDGQNSAIATILQTRQGRVFVKGLRTDHRGVVTQQREAELGRIGERHATRRLANRDGPMLRRVQVTTFLGLVKLGTDREGRTVPPEPTEHIR